MLSSIMGIDTRTTMDMDTCIKGIGLSEDKLFKIIEEIIDIDVGDKVTFEIKNNEPIREEDEYGGLKFNLVANLENIKVNLSIDIATGDIITPKEIKYEYKMIFENRTIEIMTYNVETIIAEKLQTLVSRGVLNSRMKDYYDLYYLINNEQYSINDLKMAIENTFKNRNTNVNSIRSTIDIVSENEFISKRWSEYSTKHSYSKNIKLKEIIESILHICEECEIF